MVLKTGQRVSVRLLSHLTHFLTSSFILVLNELSLSDEVPKDSVKRDCEEFEVYCPAAYRSDGTPTEDSFDNHCWINPGGIWGYPSPVKSI